ncbi:YajG family lipoprotein [Litchfieldella xinjiangensis]|uniref:YajG family lipoprotein n=1 Tax=Litchfieldella xinjiangensis TaxID=1166948 RepID=UPI0005B9FCAF|nr:YajG family lipoprotein [Halomonas xinjiangensis]
MKTRSLKGRFAFVLFLLVSLLTGCTSPHYLQPNPKITADIPQAGSGQQVTVNVVDDRETEVLGTRSGAAMSAATITVYAHDLVPQLQAQAEQAVRQMGFEPTTQTGPNRPSLTLTLVRLGYERGEGQPVLGNARLEAVFRNVAQNAGHTYTGTYTSRRDQSYAVRPNREDNTQMVNELLSDGLNRAFRDPELGRLLAR